jgi:arsenite methyltransferase
MQSKPIDPETVRQTVRQGYGQIAQSGDSCCGPKPACCGSSSAASQNLAQHIGYTIEDLKALPEGANMGLSCGNPNALAELKPGETVLDLGAGGGFDVFIAGRKVGPKGRAIGVDMTPEMLAKARQGMATYRERSGLNNVEFRLGEIEHLPLPDASVDVVISNCVINLSPDKSQVWREISRVLKPGGRVAVSDLALLKPLPPAILEMVQALVGCVAGAVPVAATEQMAKDAGLADILLTPKSAYIDGMVDWQDPLYKNILAHLPAGAKASDYLTSLEITARKPVSTAASSTAPPPTSTKPKLEVFDPAMCCSTGVCGPDVDPKLVRFAGDLKWLQEQGVEVKRFNLAQNPGAFVANESAQAALNQKGEAALPLLLVEGQVLASGDYPERDRLIKALRLNLGPATIFSPAVAELVALGAAIAANCEPCLKYHYRQAQLLGVSKTDMASALRTAAGVKDSPHQSVLSLADRLTGASLSNPAAAPDPCCGAAGASDSTPATPCCG